MKACVQNFSIKVSYTCIYIKNCVIVNGGKSELMVIGIA